VKDHTIEYHSVKILNRYGFTKRLTENLVYRFGEFIEENKIPERHNILEIQFETSGSHWNKSVLKMEIVSNRDVTWISRNDGFLTTGVYTAKLSQEKFKEIVDLLNYINFENLADEYEVGYSDAATTYLKVTYDNFKVKNIRDTGGMGTRGLRRLYDILNDLKGNQQWTKQ
jgi:predicted house-cleaning noncanonical NTP pyrophosphatase (MazG superfamily)